MNFFRMIKMDFKRMFLSGKFYFAIAGAMLVTVLNISQEAMQSRWREAFSWIITSIGACLKKASSAQKNRVSWDFFVPIHSVSFLTHKNPPDPLSDSSASSPDLSPGCSA